VRRVLAVSLASLVITGAALGGTFKGSSRPDHLSGTATGDVLYGYGGNDEIDGLAGDDLINGGAGADVLSGGAGNDRIAAADGTQDVVRCGPGRDIVTADMEDSLSGCEVVSRRLSRDRYRAGGAQHETEVEPDSFAHGSTIVTAFQVGRFVDSGAANVGFATSHDAGTTWINGILPRLSIFSAPPGPLSRVSDPVVAYDRFHRTWLIGAVGLDGDGTVLTVSRSRDGVTWGAPVTAAKRDEGDYDKEWLACDNWLNSPFRGRCYLSYMDFENEGVMTRRSLDGGRTWSEQVGWLLPPTLRDIANGVQPVVRPDGTVVIPFEMFESPGGRRRGHLPPRNSHRAVARDRRGGTPRAAASFRGHRRRRDDLSRLDRLSLHHRMPVERDRDLEVARRHQLDRPGTRTHGRSRHLRQSLPPRSRGIRNRLPCQACGRVLLGADADGVQLQLPIVDQGVALAFGQQRQNLARTPATEHGERAVRLARRYGSRPDARRLHFDLLGRRRAVSRLPAGIGANSGRFSRRALRDPDSP